jgi:hypothetical protein
MALLQRRRRIKMVSVRGVTWHVALLPSIKVVGCVVVVIRGLTLRCVVVAVHG